MSVVLYSAEKVLYRKGNEPAFVAANAELKWHVTKHPEFDREGVNWIMTTLEVLPESSSFIVKIQAVDHATVEKPKLSTGLWFWLISLTIIVLYAVFGG